MSKPSYQECALEVATVTWSEIPVSGSVTVHGILFPGQVMYGDVEVVLRRYCAIIWRWPKTYSPSAFTVQLEPSACCTPSDVCWNNGWCVFLSSTMIPTPPACRWPLKGFASVGLPGENPTPGIGAKHVLRSGGAGSPGNVQVEPAYSLMVSARSFCTRW